MVEIHTLHGHADGRKRGWGQGESGTEVNEASSLKLQFAANPARQRCALGRDGRTVRVRVLGPVAICHMHMVFDCSRLDQDVVDVVVWHKVGSRDKHQLSTCQRTGAHGFGKFQILTFKFTVRVAHTQDVA